MGKGGAEGFKPKGNIGQFVLRKLKTKMADFPTKASHLILIFSSD